MTNPMLLPDPERIALAVDTLCVGSPHPILVHAEDEPTTPPVERAFAFFFTPLGNIGSIADVIAVLHGVSVPVGWRVAGICAPITLRIPGRPRRPESGIDAWIVHVVTDRGLSASRLAVPSALDLSGAIPPVSAEHPLHRGLARLVRAPDHAPTTISAR